MPPPHEEKISDADFLISRHLDLPSSIRLALAIACARCRCRPRPRRALNLAAPSHARPVVPLAPPIAPSARMLGGLSAGSGRAQRAEWARALNAARPATAASTAGAHCSSIQHTLIYSARAHLLSARAHLLSAHAHLFDTICAHIISTHLSI